MDLRGRKAVVFGAGPVGLRKAMFLSREAEVIIVDRQAKSVPAGIVLVKGEALDNLHIIDGSDLVVAATGDLTSDEAIHRYAKDRGRPCNRSDRPGDFLIPSMVEKRNYTLAVSTLGRSPGMSRHIRLLLERELPPSLEDMVDLSERLRDHLRSALPDPAEREGRIRLMLDDPRVWEALARDREEAWRLAKEAVR